VGYIFVADCIYLSSLCSAWLTEVAKNAEKDALRGFKVIQGHRIWHQSKEHMRLPITGYYIANSISRSLSRTRFRSYGELLVNKSVSFKLAPSLGGDPGEYVNEDYIPKIESMSYPTVKTGSSCVHSF